MMALKVLIVDDSNDVRGMLRKWLVRCGMDVREAADGDSALRLIHVESPDIVLLDVRMPGMDGIETLRRARKIDGHAVFIMMTGFSDVREAVEAMMAGASNYLLKPLDTQELLRLIGQAASERQLAKSCSGVQDDTPEPCWPLTLLMGRSGQVGRLEAEVHRVAPTNFSIVITGPTGAGKEVIARAIHSQSQRHSAPFLAVDCGAIPDTLIESELFGHQKGAFTGADRMQIGKFEAASGGTLFLDEISNLPIAVQGKLLRVLQEKTVYRIGSNISNKIDVRIITATNEDLRALIAARRFREDLFHRIGEYIIRVPPLLERRDDIIFLAKRFLEHTNRELGKNILGFSEGAIEVLVSYEWPGNVRELRNVIRRAVLLSDEWIDVEQLRLRPASNGDASTNIEVPAVPPGELSLRDIVHWTREKVEREVLAQTLRKTDGNKAKAARLLQVDYKTIHTKLRYYGLDSD